MNRDKGNQTLDPKNGIKLIEMDAQQKVGLLGIKKDVCPTEAEEEGTPEMQLIHEDMTTYSQSE